MHCSTLWKRFKTVFKLTGYLTEAFSGSLGFGEQYLVWGTRKLRGQSLIKQVLIKRPPTCVGRLILVGKGVTDLLIFLRREYQAITARRFVHCCSPTLLDLERFSSPSLKYKDLVACSDWLFD